MAEHLSRRRLLAAGGSAAVAALSGCSGALGSSKSLTVRIANPGDRTYRVALALFEPDASDLSEAQVLDESYVVEPTDGFTALTEVENRRYHMRASFRGRGLLSPQYQYEYYPSCGNSDDPSPTLSVTLHSKSEHDTRFITFSQAECA